jgi:hypothetical protein
VTSEGAHLTEVCAVAAGVPDGDRTQQGAVRKEAHRRTSWCQRTIELGGPEEPSSRLGADARGKEGRKTHTQRDGENRWPEDATM